MRRDFTMLSLLERKTLQGNQVAALQERECPWIRSLRAGVCCLRGISESGRSLWAWIILHIKNKGRAGFCLRSDWKNSCSLCLLKESGLHTGGLCIPEIGYRHYLGSTGKKIQGLLFILRKNIRKRFSLLACMESLVLEPFLVCMSNTLV